MSQSLSVAFTADATQVKVASTVAKQYLQEYNSAVKDLATQIRTTGAATQDLAQRVETARTAYNSAAASVRQLSSAATETVNSSTAAAHGLEQTATAAHSAAQGSSAITREFIVMGHEALQGRFSRIPGSMMVLAEHTGFVTKALSLMTGGMWAAVGAVGALAAGMAILVIRASETESALRGVFNAAVLQGRGAALAEAQAIRFTESMQKMGVSRSEALGVGAAIASMGNLSAQAREQLGGLAADLIKVMNPEDAEKATALFKQTFGSVSAMKAFAEENKLLTVDQQNSIANLKTQNDEYRAQSVILDALRDRVDKQALAQKSRDDDFYAGVKAKMAGVTGLSNNVLRAYDQAGAGTLTFNSRIMDTFAGLEQAGKEFDKAGPVADWATQIQEKAKAAADAAETAAEKSGAKLLAIREAGTKAALAVYDAAAHDMDRTDTERAAMQSHVHDLHMSLIHEEVTASAAGAKQSAEAAIAGYNQQLAEARGNLVQVEAIETAKLAFLANTYGQASAEYRRALAEQTSALRQALQEELSEIKQGAQEKIADRKAELNLEMLAHRMSKGEEAAAEMAFNDQVHAGELRSLDDLIATLTKGTAAYDTAMKDRHKLDVEFQTSHLEMLGKIEADENAAAEKNAAQWTKAFDSITSSFSSSVAGMITGREKMLQVEQRLAGSVIQAGLEMLTHWISLEAGKTAATMLGVSSRASAEQAEGTAGLGTVLARWIGLETTKTATTTAAAATRSTADSSGGFLSGLAAIVARWTGTETAKTAATTAGVSVRTAAETTAATAGMTAQQLMARSQVAAAAAVAAAWAFADSAELGPVGLAAAPGVAAAAEATVMAFQAAIPALATGTSYVPQDMVAQIHAGEAVIPKYDADLMRGGGGSGGNHTFIYSPTVNAKDATIERTIRAQHEDFKSYIHGMMRNGQIALPGRPQKAT